MEQEWDSGILVRKVHQRCRPRFIGVPMSISLAFLAVAITAATGLCTWGIMYALNARGYDFMSEEIQEQLIGTMHDSIQAYFAPAIGTLQTLEEVYRVEAQRRGSQLAVGNASFFFDSAWSLMKQFSTGLYVGFPSNDFVGYQSTAGGNSTITSLVASAGIMRLYATDYYGHPAEQLSQRSYFPTLRPWYMGALSDQGFSMTTPYPFASSKSVGVTFTLNMFEDLQPPPFFPDYRPNVAPTGPIPNQRIVSAIFGTDVLLSSVSLFLSMLQLKGGMAWIFEAGESILMATSNVSIPTTTPQGDVLHLNQVDDDAINATMTIILRSNHPTPIDAWDYGRYRSIAPFFNKYVTLRNGSAYIISCQLGRTTGTSMEYFLVVMIPYSVYFAEAKHSNDVALLVVFLVALPVIAAIAAVFATVCLSRPTRQLALGMDQIATRFEFENIYPAGCISVIKEIRTMQQSFAAMQSALKGFGKFAPIHIVQTLLQQNQEAILGVEETEATALFSDIIGFTSISEAVAPRVLIETLAEYFNAMTSIIVTRHGVIGDFIGDAVVAFFNAPERVPRHAYLACDAALVQQETLAILRLAWKARGLPQFRIRIGINSGTCLAGNVGSTNRLKYTLIGDSINLAARLEGLGKYYGTDLTISKATYDQPGVREAFCGRVLDVVTVVGKNEATTILTLMARREAASACHLHLELLSHQMIDHYLGQRFHKCLEMLIAMNALLPQDVAIALLIGRVTKLIDFGVPADWTPACSMTNK
jgi:adenylate cyclase